MIKSDDISIGKFNVQRDKFLDNGTKWLNIEEFFLRLLSSYEKEETQTNDFKFVHYRTNVKKIPKMKVHTPLERLRRDTNEITLERWMDVKYVNGLKSQPHLITRRFSTTINSFFPPHLEMSEKLREQIYYTSRLRFSCSQQCQILMDSRNTLKEMGYSGFFWMDGKGTACNKLAFDDFYLRRFSFAPLCRNIVKMNIKYLYNTRDVTKSVQDSIQRKGSKELKRKLCDSVEMAESSRDGVVVDHMFLSCGKFIVDPTIAQFNIRGRNNRIIGIFANIEEYYRRFHGVVRPPKHLERQKNRLNLSMRDGKVQNATGEVCATITKTWENFDKVACAWCGATAATTRQCSICMVRYYCENSLCQSKDWKYHKKFCK